jgi:cobalt-zinc-cadmium efflux system protein
MVSSNLLTAKNTTAEKPMSSEHSHSHGDFNELRKKSKSAMITVLVLTITYMAIEVIAGIYTGSLALIADAGHMLGDVAALILALIAVWFAGKTPSVSKTYGYYRTEILAALLNGLALIGLSLYILYEAFQRFTHPPEILSGPMFGVAVGGLVINLIAMKLLSSSTDNSLNAKAAYLEVLGDLLGSVAVIIASLVIMFTGWKLADPLVSGFIGLMILPRTWTLIRECVHILMEGTPAHIDIQKLKERLTSVVGVLNVHDLHVWTITSGRDAISAHILVEETVQPDAILSAISDIAQAEFNLHHSTLQIEQKECKSEQWACMTAQ